MDWIGPELFALLFACALVIGFLDAICGAGGLLTVPLLLALGFEPLAALATNKLQGAVGTGSSTLVFVRAREIDPRALTFVVACAALGGALGTLAVQRIDTELLRASIPFMLIGVALYFLLSARLGDSDHPPLVRITLFAPIAGGIAFYDGLLGLGTGAFLVAAVARLLGHNLKRATAHAKLLNFASNIGSLGFFVLGGHVVWAAGFAMAAGQVIGARTGARTVMARGAALVRPLVVLTALVPAVRLILESGRH